VYLAENGSVLGYRVFLKPEGDEASKLPAKGGGRRRAYELVKLRMPQMFKAVLIRSQDGERNAQGRNHEQKQYFYPAWSAPEAAVIPSKSTPEDMVKYARPQLSMRDMTSIAKRVSS